LGGKVPGIKALPKGGSSNQEKKKPPRWLKSGGPHKKCRGKGAKISGAPAWRGTYRGRKKTSALSVTREGREKKRGARPSNLRRLSFEDLRKKIKSTKTSYVPPGWWSCVLGAQERSKV